MNDYLNIIKVKFSNNHLPSYICSSLFRFRYRSKFFNTFKISSFCHLQ